MSIEQELIELTDDDGFIKPRRVVDWAAENKESEIYQHLEWDNEKAADEYRINQARRLIAIHVLSDDGTRATISLVQDRHTEGGYRHIGPVLSNAELRLMALRQALREFRRWQRRYEHLQELARVFASADEVEGAALPTERAA